MAALSPEQLRKFHARGFLVLDGVLPGTVLDALCTECGRLLRTYRRHNLIEQGAGCILEPLGTLVTGTQIEGDSLTRDDYLSMRSKFNGPGVGAELLFGSMLCNILQQLMGEDLYLFNEQYIVKTPHAGEESKFVMHQDSQYVHGLEQEQVPPYVSVWCALDDMNEENGCLYILPYPAPPEPPTTLRDDRLLRFASPDHMRRHHLDMAHAYPSGILGGSDEVGGELPILLDRGSIVILSSLVYHRSGANISDEQRRAYMPQFSWGPIRCTAAGDTKNVAFAVPLAPPP